MNSELLRNLQAAVPAYPEPTMAQWQQQLEQAQERKAQGLPPPPETYRAKPPETTTPEPPTPPPGQYVAPEEIQAPALTQPDVSVEDAKAMVDAAEVSDAKAMTDVLVKLEQAAFTRPPRFIESPELQAAVEGQLMPLSQATTALQERSEATVARVQSMVDSFHATDMVRLRQAEKETLTAYDDAVTEARYGMPIEDVRALEDTIDAAAANPNDYGMRLQAEQAQAQLTAAQGEAGTLDPMRLWNNMSGFQQVLFLVLNAVGTAAMAAAGKGGPTPWDVAMRLMENDYQAQRDDYQRRQGKIAEKRSAYAMAAQRTSNEIEREALTMRMMLTPLQEQAAAMGNVVAADRLRQAGDQFKNQMAMSKWMTLQANARSKLEMAARMAMAAQKQQAQPGLPPGLSYIKEGFVLPKTVLPKVYEQFGGWLTAKAALDNLRRLRAQMGDPEGWAAWIGVGTHAREVEAGFGEMIDIIRKLFNWGARFERTEAELLIKKYLGSPESATDWGFLGTALAAFDQALNRHIAGNFAGMGVQVDALAAPPQGAQVPQPGGALTPQEALQEPSGGFDIQVR